MKQIVDKLNKIALAIDENVEVPTSDLIIDSLDAITTAYGGTPNDSKLIVDKLEAIASVAHGGTTPTGNIAITENTVEPLDISQYATATVNVAGGLATLIKTVNLGHLTTTSTSAVDTGITIDVDLTTDLYDFYLLIAENDPQTSHLYATMSAAALQYGIGFPNFSGVTSGIFRYLVYVNENDLFITSYRNNAVGVFIPDSGCTVSDNTLHLPIKMGYSSSYTKTVDGDFIGYLYGLNIIPRT